MARLLDEERIAELVVARLEPRLRTLVAQAVREILSPAALDDDAIDAEKQARWWKRSHAACDKKIVAVVKEAGPRIKPIMRLECGHSLVFQGPIKRGVPAAGHIGEKHQCQLCFNEYKYQHPPPKSPRQR